MRTHPLRLSLIAAAVLATLLKRPPFARFP